MLLLKSAITVYRQSKWHAMIAYTKFYNKENTDKNIFQCVLWNKPNPGHPFPMWKILKLTKKNPASSCLKHRQEGEREKYYKGDYKAFCITPKYKKGNNKKGISKAFCVTWNTINVNNTGDRYHYSFGFHKFQIRLFIKYWRKRNFDCVKIFQSQKKSVA